MSCTQCASDEIKAFNGEVAIHFPGLKGLEQPIVWVFPKMMVCLHCGFAEFIVPEEQRKQLQECGLPTLSGVRNHSQERRQ